MTHRYLKGTFIWFVLIFMLLGAMPSMAAAVDRALLVQDILPWDFTANTDALDFIGASYDTTTSDQLAAIDLVQYKVVIYASDQPQEFYNNVAAALPQIESYVEQGGVLVVHGAYGNYGTWEELAIAPGGLSTALAFGDSISVNIGHPALAVSEDPGYFDNWGSSTHGYFTSVPAGALEVAQSEQGPVYVDYTYGLGRVMAGLFTTEFAYGDRGKLEFLRAELYEALNSTRIAGGTVRDVDSSAPIAGAQMYAYKSPEWGWAGLSASGPQGTYAVWDVFHLGAESYNIEVLADGYLYDSQVVVWDGVSPAVADFDLTRADTISAGTVYDAVTDSPIAGAGIDAWRVDGGEWYWAGDTVTAADGTYTLCDELVEGPGDYEFTLWAQGYFDTGASANWDGSPLAQDFWLDPVPRIASGYVYDDYGYAVSNAMVSVYLNDEFGQSWVGDAYTDYNGAFSVSDQDQLGAGEYEFVATADGFETSTQSYSWDGVDELNFDFYLESAASMAEGYVTDLVVGDPVAEAYLDAFWYDSGLEEYQWAGWTTSDSDGYYRIYDTESNGAGTYLIGAYGYGYKNQSWEGVWDGLETLSVDFALEAAPVIANGAVTDAATSEPLWDAQIEMSRFSDGEQTWESLMNTWSGEDGTYVFYDETGYGPGEYKFTAYAEGYLTAEVTDTWDGETPLTIGFALEADPTPWIDTIAVSGPDRFSTGVEASKLAYAEGANTVVIATGRNWPDALGGTALAGALDGPILLVDTNTVPTSVSDEIDRLGATEAIILGGTSAVGTAVETALSADLGEENVDRIAGTSRYDTANQVALRTIEVLGLDYDGTAFVATGGNFPDALAAAPLAAAQGWPLYLADPKTGLSADSKAAMADVSSVLILGGTTVVSPATETYLTDTYGAEAVNRLAGGDRYKTAIAIATFAVEEAGHMWDRVGITTGANFPDALAGGVLQGRTGSVMLLTKSYELNVDVEATLSANKFDIETVTFFGGMNAVQQTVRDAVADALATDF